MSVRVPPADLRILTAMGYNPYRKFKAKPADYVMLSACLLTAAALVFWGFFS